MFSRFLHRIGDLLLVAIKCPQVHLLPWRLAEHQEIKERACREDVALHRIDGAESLGSTEIRHQVLIGESRAPLDHVGNMAQVNDGRHQHTVI